MDDMQNYVPIGPQMEVAPPDFSLAQMEPSFGEFFAAQAGEALRDSPLSSMFRMGEMEQANREPGLPYGPHPTLSGPLNFDPRPTRQAQEGLVPSDVAQKEANDAGLKVDFGKTGNYPRPAVDLMLERARQRANREETIATRQPYGVTRLGTTFLTSLADPFNIGAGFVPVIGEARYAALLAGPATFAGRTAVRAGVGAAEGLVGGALIEPSIAAAKVQEGQDFTAGMAVQDMIFSAAFGAGLHSAGGGALEKILGRTYINAPPQTPGDIIDRLPPDIRQAAIRAAISDMVEGRPVQASEFIDYATSQDPDLARSITYAQTLRRDGPAIDDVEARVAYWEGKLAGKKSAAKPQDFISWVRSLGGLRDEDGALEAYIGKGHGLPASVYVTQRGSKRTQRGVGFEDLYLQAVQEGFVNTKQEFIDAFRSHGGGIVAPILRRADSDNALKIQEEQQYIKDAIEASGVNPNAANKFKARAIAARELHVLSAERTRISSALSKLEARKQDMLQGEQPQPTPKVEEQPKPQTPKAEETKAEAPKVGDLVNIVSGEERVIATPKPVRIRRILEDPRYGTYAFVEGSETGFPLSSMDVVERGKPAETQGPLEKAIAEDRTAAKTAETVTEGERIYTYQQVRKAIETAIQVNQKTGKEGGKGAAGSTTIDIVLSDYLPGLSKKKLQPFLDRMKEEKGLGIEKGRLFFRKRSKEEVAAFNEQRAEQLVSQVRRNIDEQFPNIGKSRTYYLEDLRKRYLDTGLSDKQFTKYIRKLAEEGKARVFSQETGAKRSIGEVTMDMEDLRADIMIEFKEPPSAAPAAKPEMSVKVKLPKVNTALKIERERSTSNNNSVYAVTKGDVRIASIIGRIDPNDREIFRIGDVFATDEKGYRLSNEEAKRKLGIQTIRDIGTELQRLFPNVKKVSGERVSGVREGATQWITREIAKPKLGALTPEESAQVAKDYAAVGAKQQAVESPPADKEALKPEELQKFEAQTKAIEAQSLKKLEALLPTLPPETAANIRAALTQIDREGHDYEAVLEAATICLLKGFGE